MISILFDDGDIDTYFTHLHQRFPPLFHFSSLEFAFFKYTLLSSTIWDVALTHYPYIVRFLYVGSGADPGFNTTTTHQQNPNY
jgi:hypothetical protein